MPIRLCIRMDGRLRCFWEAWSFVLRATWHSWIFHFLMRLLPVITRLCSPRTYYYRRYTLCLRHTYTHICTHFVSRTCLHIGLVHIPTDAHTQIQVDCLYISIRMFIFNLPFSAQVLPDTLTGNKLIIVVMKIMALGKLREVFWLWWTCNIPFHHWWLYSFSAATLLPLSKPSSRTLE